MSLEVPNLDDRRWAELVEEARSLIPRVAPLWTDHNVHDPGMTFIELFAWLAEMQVYQLNRVGRKHRELFSQLVGITRGLRQPAQVAINVEGSLAPGRFMLAGTQLTPIESDEIIFEIQRDIFLTQSVLQRVITVEGSQLIDQTAANSKLGIVFLPFGENAQQGAELRLGFDKFYPDTEPEIRLTARVFTDDLGARCSANAPAAETADQKPIGRFVELAWQYLAVGNKWETLEVDEKDETSAFTHSGAITLPVPRDAVKGDGDYYWIHALIKEGHYDIEPRLRSINLNVLPCAQVETVRDEDLKPVTGLPNQTFELSRKPILVREAGRRGEITSSDVSSWEELAKELRLVVPELPDKFRSKSLPGDSKLFEFERITELNRVLSTPSEITETTPRENKQIDYLVGASPVVITVDDAPWHPVASFENSDPTSKHYVVDTENATIEFGNGLNGLIPLPGQQVRATWYQASQGGSGNVSKGLQWRFRNAGIPGVTLTNPQAASGGADPETLDAMELRTKASLNRPQRGVTLKDLEHLALTTQGAYVARAKAITDCPVPESITVVAVPKIRPGRTGPPKPPSRLFLRMVQRNLQNHRLLCDSLRVIGPVYIEVKVSAHLRLLKGAAAKIVIERANQALDRFLRGQPEPGDQNLSTDRDLVRNDLAQSPCFTRWPFGRQVFPSEVYAILDGVAGIDFVSRLVLSASKDGVAIQPSSSGAIKLPPAGLVYGGQHELTAEADSGRNG